MYPNSEDCSVILEALLVLAACRITKDFITDLEVISEKHDLK